LSLANQLRLMADFSRWLTTLRVAPSQIDALTVGSFLEKRRRTHTQFFSQRAIRPLLAHLVGTGVVTFDSPAKPRRAAILEAYERYLVEDRAVGERHKAMCLGVADEFLDGGKRDTGALSASDVTRFINRDRPSLSGCLTGLRSILRFLFITKRLAANLVYAVPRSPSWQQRSLPQPLESQQLVAVLATCDRRSVVGRRDYAVLLLMGRLGLRAGEVAGLRLDDIDWRAGELVVHGKGSLRSRLPLPLDVGEAIAEYLRRVHRDRAVRSVFVRCAPYGSLTSGGISAIAKTALHTVGITGGAHRLRHTAATQMLRRGASLTEIAQVLRHRHVNTTAIYAKVDHGRLRELARVWPSDDTSVRELVRTWPGGAA
jgi:site-specific recombinase XerD